MSRRSEYALKERIPEDLPKKKIVPHNCITCANDQCRDSWAAVTWTRCRGWEARR